MDQVLSSHSSRRLIVMERKPGEVKLNKTQNSKYQKKQVDGAVAVVDPRLGEFKEQFMLPVGSVIPKYVGVEIHWILENLCPGYLR